MSATREQRNELWFQIQCAERTIFAGNPFPLDLVKQFMLFGDAKNKDYDDVAEAFRLAVAREENPEENKFNLTNLKKMLDANPRLVLYAGTVKTRAGLLVKRTTLLKFAIYSLDSKLAELVMPYYDHPLIEGGAALREAELVTCRPHIDALVRELEFYQEQKKSTYDLTYLFDIIDQASDADVAAELATGTQYNWDHKSTLRSELNGLRNIIRLREKTEGMHCPFLVTLMQAFDLRIERWGSLSRNDTNYARLELVWKQVIGPLEDKQPTVLRIGLARAFQDNKETLSFVWEPSRSFPDGPADEASREGLSFDYAIFGWGEGPGRRYLDARLVARGLFWISKNIVEHSLQICRTYAPAETTPTVSMRDSMI